LDLHKDHVMGEIYVIKSLNTDECKSYIAKLLHISMDENASKRMAIEMAESEEQEEDSDLSPKAKKAKTSS
jgi:hypothetical protein